MALSFDGPFPKLCLAVTLSHQDGHHSAVALLLKAALIQVSYYRLLGASGCNLQSQARTQAVLVIHVGLYELLGNPTSKLIEPPEPRFKRNLTGMFIEIFQLMELYML